MIKLLSSNLLKPFQANETVFFMKKTKPFLAFQDYIYKIPYF